MAEREAEWIRDEAFEITYPRVPVKVRSQVWVPRQTGLVAPTAEHVAEEERPITT